MKISYLILNHKNPVHLEYLIKTLDHPNVNFCIHVDKKARYSFNRFIKKYSNKDNVYFIRKRIRVHWGDISIVKATILLIRESLRRFNSDYYILLSGDHYPIKSNSSILDFLDKNNGYSFMKYWSIPNNTPWCNEEGGGLGRIEYFHISSESNKILFYLQKIYYLIDKKVGQIGILIWKIWPKLYLFLTKKEAPDLYTKKDKIQKRRKNKRPKRQFLSNMKPYGGSQWWILSREAIIEIVNTLDNKPEVYEFFKNTWIPDETFFQTILINSNLKNKIVKDNLLYFHWDKEKYHPIHLKKKHFQRLKDSRCLFARKISLHSESKLIRLIDNEILKKDEDVIVKMKKMRNDKIKELIDVDSKDLPDKKAFEIVVAKYKENLDWLEPISKNTTIYSKGIANDNEIPLPNFGYEGGTYLHHIVENYSNLAEKTLFLQGDPFPHRMLPLSKYLSDESSMIADFDLSSIHAHHTLWWTIGTKQVIDYPVMVQFAKLIECNTEGEFNVNWGAQFAVDRDLILKKPKEYWEKLLKISQMKKLELNDTEFDNKNIAFLFEFFWWRIFNDNV